MVAEMGNILQRNFINTRHVKPILHNFYKEMLSFMETLTHTLYVNLVNVDNI